MIPVAFLLANPAMPLHAADVLVGLRAETVTVHLGADGLCHWATCFWYLSNGLPIAAGWAQWGAAAVGVVLALRRHRVLPVLLTLVYALALLVAVSLSPRHFGRYIIQILPVVALLAAYTLECIFAALRNQRGRYAALARPLFAVLLVGLLLIRPTRPRGFSFARATPTRACWRVLWIEENLPQGSHLLQEGYGPFLAGTTYVVTDKGTLANVVAAPFAADGNLQALRQEGYDYVSNT